MNGKIEPIDARHKLEQLAEEYGYDAGWCDECGTATVVSGLVLARIR